VGFCGACRLQKNAPRGLGQGIAPRQGAKHTIRLWLCALTDRREMRNYASAVKKLSAWVFFFERGERFFTALATFSTPYAGYSLYALPFYI